MPIYERCETEIKEFLTSLPNGYYQEIPNLGERTKW